MQYAVARYEQEQETTAYRIYVTDCLYSINHENIKERFWDLINQTPQPEDTRTGDEIAFDIIKRMGLKMQGGEE